MQLPHPVEIAGPGAAGIRIAGGAAPQGQQGLQLGSQLERVWAQLNLTEGHRKQGLDHKRSRGGQRQGHGDRSRHHQGPELMQWPAKPSSCWQLFP